MSIGLYIFVFITVPGWFSQVLGVKILLECHFLNIIISSSFYEFVVFFFF
jgi:hypothetical protein